MQKFYYIVGCGVSGERLLLDLEVNTSSIKIVKELDIKCSRKDDDGDFDAEHIYVPIAELGFKGFELAYWGEDMNMSPCVVFKKSIEVIEDKPFIEA